MATLSILRFSTVGGAQAALGDLRILCDDAGLAARDLALVSWSPGRSVPDIQAVSMPRPSGRMGGAFWNLLFSHVFFLPVAVAEAGLRHCQRQWSLADLGIRDDFLSTAQERLTCGTSALFVLTDDATVDPVVRLLGELPFTVMSTNLSTRQLEALRLGFGSTTSEEATGGETGSRAGERPGPR